MGLSIKSVGEAFAALEAGGCKAPYRTDSAIREGQMVFRLLLGDLDDVELMRAVGVYLRRANPHWPTPGQLLQCVARTVETRYEESWAMCVRNATKQKGCPGHSEARRSAIRRMTDHGWVEFPPPQYAWEVDDATWRGIQACGGWRTFKEMSTSQIVGQRAAFRGAYEGAVQQRDEKKEQATARALIDGTLQLGVK